MKQVVPDIRFMPLKDLPRWYALSITDRRADDDRFFAYRAECQMQVVDP